MKMATVVLLASLLVGAAAAVLLRPYLLTGAAAPAAPAPTPAPQPPQPQPPDPAEIGKDAEPLPELHKADPKSVLKALLPEKTLYLETKPDDTRRVHLATEVCLREGFLEVLLCKKNTKEHEAILRTDVDARYVHAALIAAGAKPGSPVRFLNPKTDEPDYHPATGTRVNVLVHYRKGGTVHTHPAQEWIFDLNTKKPMGHHWVFAGSRFVKNPDRPQDPEYYTANNGEVISISNFVDSMLEVPVEVSRDNVDLNFEAKKDVIPPLLSKVWVILEPATEKKK